MSAPTHAVSPLKPEEESATTREEMDFDDPTSPDHTGGRVSPISRPAAEAPVSKSPSPRPRVAFQEQTENIPPSQPPRPADPMAQAEHTLIEAFPTIDAKVIKAVLVASGGKVEPAFNALLSMSDPDFRPESQQQAPQQPPRPPRQPRNQMEADEIYARQLAEEYDAQQQGNMYNQRAPGHRGPNAQRPQYTEERERSFLDDDLPEIGRNIQQGFVDTQKKVNTWIQNFKKRLDGEDEDEEDLYSSGQGRQNFGPSQSDQLRGIQRQQDAQRRSVEQQRYDADPHAFSDEDFSRLELRDDEAPPQLPRRPPQSGPVDEVEHAEQTNPNNRKWQSLTSVSPHPEDDNDPFALGDDEEKEEKSEEIRKDDSERLKEAARNSISEADKTSVALEENKMTGTKNADAEKLLTK